jgi:uncharacterized protein (TIGR03083 family)
MADRMQLAADERRDLADLLDTLDPEQWAHPSLCEGWAVRDVVAHLISYEESVTSAWPARSCGAGSGCAG